MPFTKISITQLLFVFTLSIVIVSVVLGGYATVPAGSVGIQDTFGQVAPTTLQPGFHLKLPITRIIPMTTQTLKYGTTASAASKDLQDVKSEVTLNYHIGAASAVDIYKNLGLNYEDKVIIPAVQESVKAATAEFTAAELITKRPEVKVRIEKQLSERLAVYNLTVETTSLTDFQFSESFSSAIEAKVTAEQEALKARNVLEQVKIEKEQTITRAEAEAESVRLAADALAYQIKAKADSDAYGLEVVRKQLEQNQKLIDYRAIEKWNGTVPTYVGTGNAIPFLNLNPSSVN